MYLINSNSYHFFNLCMKFSEELCPLIQQTCAVRALLNASSLLPPVEYNGIHDDDIFLGDGSHVDDIGMYVS